MLLSKRAKIQKNQKNKGAFREISLLEEKKIIDPYDFMDLWPTSSLSKFIKSALDVFLSDVQILGRFEIDNENILALEDFLIKTFEILQIFPKARIFLAKILEIGHALILFNKPKGEYFGFSIRKMDYFLDYFMKISENDSIKGKIGQIQQKINDIRNFGKVSFVGGFNNGLIIEDYIQKSQEYLKLIENEENSLQKNLEIEQNETIIEKKDIKENEKTKTEKKIIIEDEIKEDLEKTTLDNVEVIDFFPSKTKGVNEVKPNQNGALSFIGKDDLFPSTNIKEFKEIELMPKINLEDDD